VEWRLEVSEDLLVHSTEFGGSGLLTKAIANGIGGGIVAELQGGKFGHGFVSAGIGSLAGDFAGRIDGQVGFSIKRTVVAAIAGGTASTVTGGKFASGALSSAMSQAFGDWSNGRNGGKYDAESEGTRDAVEENARDDQNGQALFDSVLAEYDKLGWTRGKVVYVDKYAVFFSQKNRLSYFNNLDDAMNAAFMENGSIYTALTAPDGAIVIYRRATLAGTYRLAFNSMNPDTLTTFHFSRRDNLRYTIGHELRHHWDRLPLGMRPARGENHHFAVRAGIYGCRQLGGCK
jgi:hypothetical protein